MLISSASLAGTQVSSFITGFLLAKIGRRSTILVMAVPFITGWVMLALALPLDLGYPWYFYIGRILTGKDLISK